MRHCSFNYRITDSRFTLLITDPGSASQQPCINAVTQTPLLTQVIFVQNFVLNVDKQALRYSGIPNSPDIEFKPLSGTQSLIEISIDACCPCLLVGHQPRREAELSRFRGHPLGPRFVARLLYVAPRQPAVPSAVARGLSLGSTYPMQEQQMRLTCLGVRASSTEILLMFC